MPSAVSLIFPFYPSLVTTSGSDQILFIPRLKFAWPACIKDLQQNYRIKPLLAVLFYCFSFFLVLLIPSCSNLVATKDSSNNRMINSMKTSSWSSSSSKEQMISLYSFITICAALFIMLPFTLTNSNYSTNKSKSFIFLSLLLYVCLFVSPLLKLLKFSYVFSFACNKINNIRWNFSWNCISFYLAYRKL